MKGDSMNEHYPFVNPPLPYAYDALEPFIDTKTMHLHHDRHLQTYVNNLNDALKDYPQLQSWSLERLIYNAGRLPLAVRQTIINNAGGVYNHILYFNGMINPSEGLRRGKLYSAIVKDFGTVDNFLEELKNQALSVFGSGYAWLVVTPWGNLRIVTSANQNTPIAQNLCPVLTTDVWEHAYYLKHYNERAAYIDDWLKVVNWKKAEELYNNCISGTKGTHR